MRVFYLHGFASSAASSKAAYFKNRFAEHGISLQTPDFNEPDFSTLTITRMVGQVLADIDALPPQPVVLIGSSLGAFVAVQATEHQRRRNRAESDRGDEALAPRVSRAPSGAWIDRLVLLAPALDFGGRREFALGDRTHEAWKATGFTNVFHYGYGRVIPVGYELYTDACGYECESLELSLPIIVFQGRRDSVVDPASVERWAEQRPNVELHMLDDDHQLAASLPVIWTGAARFLGVR